MHVRARSNTMEYLQDVQQVRQKPLTPEAGDHYSMGDP